MKKVQSCKGTKVQRKRTPNIEHRTSNEEVDPNFRWEDKKGRRKMTVMKKKVPHTNLKSKVVRGKPLRLPAVAQGKPLRLPAVAQGKPLRLPAVAQGKRIKLTWGKYVIVDAEDYDWLRRYKWLAVEQGRSWYAKTLKRDGMSLAMHRLIMDAPKHLMVDHIDHDGLNNRKSNLRLCTRKQNRRNSRPRPGGSSRYKGVCRCKGRKKFRAEITHHYKRIYLGRFKNEIEAAKAYDEAAKKLFGEFAYLNFP